MAESEAIRHPVRRAVLGPVTVTGALVALAVAAALVLSAGTGPMIVGTGWVLAWLLLGLTAGYALSGSV